VREPEVVRILARSQQIIPFHLDLAGVTLVLPVIIRVPTTAADAAASRTTTRIAQPDDKGGRMVPSCSYSCPTPTAQHATGNAAELRLGGFLVVGLALWALPIAFRALAALVRTLLADAVKIFAGFAAIFAVLAIVATSAAILFHDAAGRSHSGDDVRPLTGGRMS
jgi:hypothetical protein